MHTLILSLTEQDRTALHAAGVSEEVVYSRLREALRNMIRGAKEMQGEVVGPAAPICEETVDRAVRRGLDEMFRAPWGRQAW